MIIFRTEASSLIGFHRVVRSSYLARLCAPKSDLEFLINNDKIGFKYLDQKKLKTRVLHKLEEINLHHVKSIIFDMTVPTMADLELIQRAKEAGKKTVALIDSQAHIPDTDYVIGSGIQSLSGLSGSEKNRSGPEYTILHHQFRHFHRINRKYNKKVSKILLCLGSQADYRTLKRVIDILCRFSFQIKIAGGFYLRPSVFKVLRRLFPGIRVVGRVESLARSIFESDIALIPPGQLAWEAASVGTPILFICSSSPQEKLAADFSRQYFSCPSLSIQNMSKESLYSHIQQLSWKKRVQQGQQGKKIIDAKGAYRIIDFFKNKGII